MALVFAQVGREAEALLVGWRCEVELERRNFARGLGLMGRIW